MPCRLEVHRAARKELDGLPPKVRDGIIRVLRDLAKDPADPRFDVRRIQGHTRLPPTMRLRIGAYRVLYKHSEERELIRVLRVGHRRSVYRGLDHLDEGIG